jgi:hypothetical protein
MSRQPDPGFDHRIADWLEADPDHAPAEVLRTVESALPSIPQLRTLRLPWTNLPANRLVILGASVALLAALGVGAWTVGSRPKAPAVLPAPSVPAVAQASPDQSPPADALVVYVAARDDLCRAYDVELQPLKARMRYLFDPEATDAGRADAVAAVSAFAARYGDLVDDLLALQPPEDLRTAHVMNAARFDDIRALLFRQLSLLNLGEAAQAQAVGEATNAIAAQVKAYEVKHGLTGCP